jgi:small ligand-binding sensory domain FIST
MAAVDKPEDLIGGYFDGLEELPAGVARYTGDIPGADFFAMALIDPGNGRTLWHDYDTSVLPLVS